MSEKSTEKAQASGPSSYRLLEKYLGRPVTQEEHEKWQEVEAKKTFLPAACQPHYFPTVACEHVVRSLTKGDLDSEDRKSCLDLHGIFLGCIAEHVESGSYKSDHPTWQQWVRQHRSMKERMDSLYARQSEMRKAMRELPLEQKIKSLTALGMSEEEATKMAPEIGINRGDEQESGSPLDEFRRKYKESLEQISGSDIVDSTTDTMTSDTANASKGTKKAWWKLW